MNIFKMIYGMLFGLKPEFVITCVEDRTCITLKQIRSKSKNRRTTGATKSLIRDLNTYTKLTDKEIAHIVNVSKQYVSKIIND